MVEKKSMVKEIGEEEILLPDLVNAALTANDQIKYYLALLQSAQQRAEHPSDHFNPMREERELVQEDDARLDTVIAGSVKKEDRLYSIPLLDVILAAIRARLEQLLHPFLTMDDEPSREFRERADRLLRDLPARPEAVTAEQIQALTSGDRPGPDSVHLLVMDLHRALNALQAGIAEEDIKGAKTYRLPQEDKELVASFMDGLNRTAPLKFEHPGLGTTATRSGDRLVIQNDIGETEAHLMIIHVTGLEVSIVQTDVHLPRVLFFQGLFRDFGVQWQDTISRTAAGETQGLYHLSRGRFAARDRDQLRAFLNFLGAKIVFLIDWNRARKRLQSFLPKRDAVSVLRWAAENEVGHRGFLVLGGDQLVFEALELAPRVPLRYGQPLYQVLGRDRTVEFFRSALRKSAVELLAQKPIRLIQDEIKADLLNYFRPAPQDLMALSIQHATLVFEVASTLRAAIHGLEQGREPSRVERDADRSKKWEKDADNIVSRVRTLAKTMEVAAPFVELAVMADDAIDYLEEAMYLMTLAGPEARTGGGSVAELGIMADIAVASCQEFIKSLYAAEHAYDRCTQNNMADFLRPVDAVIELEEQCDRALRRALAVIYTEPAEVKGTVLALDLARNIEESTNSLMKAAYILKENVFGNVGSFEVR